jgi:hypothetical protein
MSILSKQYGGANLAFIVVRDLVRYVFKATNLGKKVWVYCGYLEKAIFVGCNLLPDLVSYLVISKIPCSASRVAIAPTGKVALGLL